MLRGALEARRAHVGRERRRLANAERAIWKSALRSKFRAGGRRGRGSELPEITARERDEANGEAAANTRRITIPSEAPPVHAHSIFVRRLEELTLEVER